MALVADPQRIRLAMLGMVPLNGHPYSWSAIINGRYDAAVMAECGYPVIPQYLGAEPQENLGIPGAQVTHIWCENPADAAKVARATFIPNVVARATDVIGQVDAVIIPADLGHEHVERCRPFIEAGVPMFIDKPLVDREDHLRQFVAWQRQGKPFLSTSCMKYSREFADVRAHQSELGDLRLITMSTPKNWERYGIHVMEGIYPFLQPGGWKSVTNSGRPGADITHVRHASGVDVLVYNIDDMIGAFAYLTAYGTRGVKAVKAADTFFMFKSQLVAFVEYLRTGRLPFDFAETVELMKIVIAGIRSRDQGGRRVELSEIREA